MIIIKKNGIRKYFRCITTLYRQVVTYNHITAQVPSLADNDEIKMKVLYFGGDLTP